MNRRTFRLDFRAIRSLGIFSAVILGSLVCGRPAASAAAVELPKALLPEGTDGVVLVRLGDIFAHPDFEDIRPSLGHLAEVIDEPLDVGAKLTWRGVERAWIVSDPNYDSPLYIIMFKLDNVANLLNVDPKDKTEVVGGRAMTYSDDTAGCFVDGKTMITGPVGAVRSVLLRDGDAKLSKSLVAAWAAVDSKKSISFVASNAAVVRYMQMEEGNESFPALIDGLEMLSMELAFDDRISLTFRGDCKDAASATRLEQLIAEIVNVNKASGELSAAWIAAFESFRTSSKEKRFTVDWKVDAKLLLEAQ